MWPAPISRKNWAVTHTSSQVSRTTYWLPVVRRTTVSGVDLTLDEQCIDDHGGAIQSRKLDHGYPPMLQ